MSTPVTAAAALLRTLGDETRLQLLALLRRREFCVCELVDLFPISQPAISGHLRRLKDAGLAQDDRRGMWVYYRACETVPPLAHAILGEVVLPPELESACAPAEQGADQGACCDAAPQHTPTRGPRTQGKHGTVRGGPVPHGRATTTTNGRLPG
jgi:DNA-binding transcriptional ArsR family regulator